MTYEAAQFVTINGALVRQHQSLFTLFNGAVTAVGFIFPDTEPRLAP